MKKPFFVLLQYAMPQHFFSRTIASLMLCRQKIVKNAVIRWFVKRYEVDLSEAQRENVEDYTDFNDFFTRALKPGLRPIQQENNGLVSPVDGFVSESGKITAGQLLQAKGVNYSLDALIAGDNEWKKRYESGGFCTFYLSPKDYHCVHMPIDGTLCKMTYVPGKLFSVNLLTAEHVPGLFSKNERLICEFETSHGRMLVIFVGAVIVSGIYTEWAGQITPRKDQSVESTVYQNGASYQCGDKIGHFNVGSTIILLTEKPIDVWPANTTIKMGESIANF